MRALVALAAAAALVSVPAPALAQAPAEPFDGTIPFDCVLQQVGTGTDFPDPDADPFCVEYDKRHQNVTELGVVEFLSLEPARVAAATSKCFYYQRDHWVGSVIQGNGATQTYAWDGSYYFDKAKAAGGAYIENFTINGRSGDPTALPGFPEQWKPYFGYGRGGVHAPGSIEADPDCVAKAEEESPYRTEPEPKPGPRGCPQARGGVGRRIGGLALGETRGKTIERNGEPKYVRRRFLRYCVNGGGKYMAGFPSKRSGAQAQFLLTSNPGFATDGVRRLTPKRQARQRLEGERFLFRTRRTRVWAVPRRSHLLLVMLRKGRVAALASAARSLPRERLIAYYRASR
ncbi:MAG TPA: hypothetical protein VD790_01765 [Thermoleophilaceae bacterium]|nr:hypothetical protein [Thermoleophilaceae bacterium]